jgi:Uma2 family endonuclease
MQRFEEISKQVMRLSPDDRLLLVDWIMDRTGGPVGVAEAAPDQGLMTDRSRKVTLEEFLEFERSTPLAHEFVAGEIYAMSEPSHSHDLVVTNLIADVRNPLRGRPCRTHTSSKKVQFKCRDDDIVYRPDLWVACGQARDADGEFIEEPRLVSEVLSRSTERIDRREKALNYREIPTLEEIVLVAQRAAHITLFRRSDLWRPVVLRSMDDALELRSIELTLPLQRVYESLP